MDVQDWLRFIGTWLGDGSAYDAGRGNYVVKLAVVSKVEKRKYFKELLAKMGVNFIESEWGFSFQDKAVCEYLKPFSGAYNKRIPLELKNLPSDLLFCIIEGMMRSDGNIESDTYVSVSKGLVDDFNEICLKAGFNCTQWSKLSPPNNFLDKELLVHKARYSQPDAYPNKITPTHCHETPYNGFVYDVTVENHVFLSKRNGRASWTGNSWKGFLTLEFGNNTDFPCRVYANEGILQILFLKGNDCDVSYGDRKGKYQNQSHEVHTARA
jgi:dCTP deaminase